jgi:hypothetical protein
MLLACCALLLFCNFWPKLGRIHTRLGFFLYWLDSSPQGSIFRSENVIYSPPLKMKFFPLLRHIVFWLPSWPFCLDSSLFCNYFTLLLPSFSFSFPFLPFSLHFPPFSLHLFIFFISNYIGWYFFLSQGGKYCPIYSPLRCHETE